MIVLYVSAGLAVALVVVLLDVYIQSLTAPWRPVDEADVRAAVELHRIRRERDLAQFRSDMAADAARLRRELQAEFDAIDASERSLLPGGPGS